MLGRSAWIMLAAGMLAFVLAAGCQTPSGDKEGDVKVTVKIEDDEAGTDVEVNLDLGKTRAAARAKRKAPRLLSGPRDTAAMNALDEIAKSFSLSRQHDYQLSLHHLEAGKRLYDEFKYREAEREFRRAYDLNPQLLEAEKFFRRAGFMLKKRYSEFEFCAGNLYRLRKVSIQQKMAELERIFNAGKRLFEAENYDAAIEQFELSLEIIRWFPYRIDNNNYKRQSEKHIIIAERRKRWKKLRERELELTHAIGAAEREEYRENARRQIVIDRIIARIQEALRLRKYAKAEELCEELIEKDPHSKKAEKFQELAIAGRHLTFKHRTFVDYYEHMTRNMERWNETYVPYTEYARWPEKDKWLQICNRLEGVAVDIDEEPEEVKQIKNIINTRKVTLTFDGATLAEVVSFLQDITNLNITIDPTIGEDDTVTLHLREVVLKNALDIICKQIGKAYVFRENVIFITDKEHEHGKGIFEIYNVSDILAKVNNFAGPILRVFDPMDSAGGGTGVSFDDEEEEDESWLDPDKLIELIQNGTGEDLWPEGEGGFGTITYHRGQLIVINTREVHRAIRRILHNLRKCSGIFIVMEARFIEVYDDFLRDVGVDSRGLGTDFGSPFTILARDERGGQDAGWVFDPDPNNTVAGRWQNIIDGHDGFLSGDRLQDQNGGGFLRITTLDPFQLTALIHMKDEYCKRRQLTAATVTATNQQRVFISVVNQRAYIADYELGGGGTGLIVAEIADPMVRNFQEGIVLDVRPVVSSDRKYITIDVRPTVATLVGQTISTVIVNLGTTTAAAINAPIEIPEIQLQQTMTTVTIPDGGTIMLGGLQERTYRKYVSTTPILGAVPFLKLLFTRTAEVDERRHLIVLLTGKIILLRDMEEEKFGTGKEY